MTTIIGLKVQNRNDNANKIQHILTKYGCVINTRLGLHSQDEKNCSSEGLILLEIIDNTQAIEIEKELCDIEKIELQKMVF